MKNFSAFLTEAEEKKILTPDQHRIGDDLVTTFGRFNPPHKGHLKAMDYADNLASSIGDKAPADQRFYASKSNDPKKNPLDYDFKMKQLQKMFPKHSQKWDTDKSVRTVLDAAKKGHQAGYKNFHFVGGGDRRQGMEDLLRRYNGDLYQFDNIYSHSAGERDESKSGDDPIAQLSASGQRKFAMDGDFDGFKGGLDLSDGYTEEDARELFYVLRNLMGQQNEEYVDYRSNKSTLHEVYRSGELFSRGDLVESLTTGLRGKVHRCGANHLICVTENGLMFKSFIHDVHAV